MLDFFKRCKHDYKLVSVIGGDTQARAYACEKCGKKKVKVNGINGKPDFDYVVKHGEKINS